MPGLFAEVVATTLLNGHVVYRVAVRAADGRDWIVATRYSDMHEFVNKIKAEAPLLAARLSVT